MTTSNGKVLGEFFTLQRGTTYKSRLLGEPGPILLGLATIRRNGGFRSDSLRTYGGDSPDKLLVKPGDLYVSLKDVTQSADLLGAVARLPRDSSPGRLTQDTVKLIPKNAQVPNDYLYWALRSPSYRSYCRAHATGTTNLGLPREDFLNFPIPQLDAKRKCLVEALSTLEEKIDLNRRMNETLEAMARAIFKAWFVDFNPVRTKVEGRPSSLPGVVAGLFPDRFVSSDVGELPKGWESAGLGQLLDLNYGKALKAEDRRHGNIPVFGSNGQVGWHDSKLADGPGIIVGRKGNPGIVTWAPTDFFAIDTTFYVVPKTKCWSLPFLFYALRAHNLGLLGADSAVPGLNRNIVYMSRQAIPPPNILKVFDEQVFPLFNRIRRNDEESSVLAAVRDTLLPKLISGAIQIARADRVLQEAK